MTMGKRTRKQAIVGSQEEKDLKTIIPTAAKIYLGGHGEITKIAAIKKAIEKHGILNTKLPEPGSMTQYLTWMEEFHANNDTPKFASTKTCKETVIVHCYEDVYGVPLKGYEKKKDALQIKFSNNDLKEKASTNALIPQEDLMEQQAAQATEEFDVWQSDLYSFISNRDNCVKIDDGMITMFLSDFEYYFRRGYANV